MKINTTDVKNFNFCGKKVFISQPMRNKTEEQIRRETLIKEIEASGGKVIDSVFPEFNKEQCKNVPLKYLAKSLELLAEADIAIFMSGWEEARDCKIEHECCEEYDVSLINLKLI